MGQIYQKFNKERIFDYKDSRASTFNDVLRQDSQNMRDAKMFGLGGPKGLSEFKKAV